MDHRSRPLLAAGSGSLFRYNVRWLYKAFLTIVILMGVLRSYADPVSGDIFKEYYMKHSVWMYPNHAKSDSITYPLIIDDLVLAVKAEIIAVGVQPGHIGTGDISFRVNNGKKRLFPQPETPGIPNCYFYKIHGRDCVDIPLSELNEGENSITVFLGEQLCHGFDWPGVRLDDIGVRVYYGQRKKHPSGKIANLVKETTIDDDRLRIEVLAQSENSSVTSVELIGFYYHYPLDGTTEYQKWNYYIREQQWEGIIGKRSTAPFFFDWDLRLWPDQEMPMKVMVKITDANGVAYMTQNVVNLHLIRKDRSVKLFKPYDVPENFKVRIGQTQTSKCDITENICLADTAILINSKIYIGHLEDKYLCQFGINNIKLMDFRKLRNHHPADIYPDQFLPIPLGIIKNGVNEFYIYDNTEGHMAEVYWPGPAILAAFDYSKENDVNCDNRKTYNGTNGPMYDVEYFNYSASDSVLDQIYDNTERYHLVKANEVNDYIDYEVYIPKGEYHIKLAYIKSHGDGLMSRGQCRLLIDGVYQGEVWDQYGDYMYEEIYLGRKKFVQTGNKIFRLQVEGKHDLSQSPFLSLCYIGFEEVTASERIPSAPTKLEGQSVDGLLELRWKDNAHNEQGYVIEMKSPDSKFINVATVERNVTHFYQRYLKDGTLYSSRIKAFNDSGYSAYSNLVTVKYRKP